MRLARVTTPVEAAAERLRALDQQRTKFGQNGMPVALAGGFGKQALNQSHEDVLTIVEAVLGRGPTLTEIKGAFGDGDAA